MPGDGELVELWNNQDLRAKEEDKTTIEEQGEKKQESSKRQSFRKILGDDNAVFFQNIETEETVWEVPKNGDLVEL